MIIEGVTYKQVDRKDYGAYLKECADAKVAPSFKAINGVVWYRVAIQPILMPDNAIKNSESDLVTDKKPVSPFESVATSILSDVPTTVKKDSVIKKLVADFKRVTFPLLFGKNTLYQYCDKCETETVHNTEPKSACCTKCQTGYWLK